MLYGIIDLGSNSIRLSVYQYENDEVKLLTNKKETVGIFSYVSDDVLSDKGIKKVCKVLTDLKNVAEYFEISKKHIYVFATASLRNISNTDETLKMIKKVTNLEIEVISGEEEATLDFFGVLPQILHEDGVLIDIGGGSTEIVTFKSKEICQAKSLPIGSLNVFLNNVDYILPGKKETNNINKVICEKLKDFKFDKLSDDNILVGIGGSVRATRKIYNDYYSLSSANRYMEVEKLKEMMAKIKASDKDMVFRILQICPERIHTVIPGMLILNTIAKESKCDKIYVSNKSVRDGYLNKRVL